MIVDFRNATTSIAQTAGDGVYAEVQHAAPVRRATWAETSGEHDRDDKKSNIVDERGQASIGASIFDQQVNSMQSRNMLIKTGASSVFRSKMASVQSFLGAGRTDPFLTYPLPVSDFENVIIDYCESCM